MSSCGVGPCGGGLSSEGDGIRNSLLGGLGGEGGVGECLGGRAAGGCPPPVPPGANGPRSGGGAAHPDGVDGIAWGLCLRGPMLRGLPKARRVAP